jgi:glycosyltransferase involved in cell wall biosynthesis
VSRSLDVTHEPAVAAGRPAPRPLSVLHIGAADNFGGPGRIAYRLHSDLRRRGHRSRMLVGRMNTRDPDVRHLWGSPSWQALDWVARRVTDRLSLQYLFLPSSWRLPRHPWVRDADVVQLYNVHGGHFSYPVLPRLSRGTPVVWRLSDMWAMTGHCCYSHECDRWLAGCGACPLLFQSPSLRTDRTALLWRAKRRVYARARVILVAPSRWMAGRARASPLLSRFPVHLIPNGLDTTVFRPVPKPVAREALGLPPRARIVLFSAVEVDAPRKGATLLREALATVAERKGPRCHVLLVGRGAAKLAASIPLPARSVEQIHDDETLARVYSAADLLVYPALADNLANTVLESMACGTPVVSFDVGGLPEVVRHMETGYLARGREAAVLARGIELLIADDTLSATLGARARTVIETGYRLEQQTSGFEALYRDLVADRAARAGS